jgi:hypothetical protein
MARKKKFERASSVDLTSDRRLGASSARCLGRAAGPSQSGPFPL